MSYYLTPQEWLEYETAINNFQEDAFRQVITWNRCIRALNTDGNDSQPLYKEATLKGLIQYNDFRSWPINADTPTGEVDKESILVFLNNKFLDDNGFLNAHGQFNFKPSLDKFIINGIRYKSKGDSQTAQSFSSPLLHFMVLLRDYTEAPDNKY